MNRESRYALLVVIVGACVLHAQSVGRITKHPLGQPWVTKAENGLIISWLNSRVDVVERGETDDPEAGRVDVFDERGGSIASFNVLRLVEGARGVSIYDASSRPGGIIAVGAVYASKDRGIPPAASLLVFDSSGRLLSAYALADARIVKKLAVDKDSNIWTLTDNFRDTEPSTAPMVVEYAPDGKEVRELLPRSVLWSHGTPKEGLYLGRVTMGCGNGVAWIWLPGTTELVTISTSDGTVSVVQTGLPRREKHKEDPLDVVREPAGDAVGAFREDGEDGKSEIAYYAWSPSTRAWSRFQPGACDGDRLLSVSDSGQIYHDRQGNICLFRR